MRKQEKERLKTDERYHGCVYFLKKKYCANKRFPVTSNLRYMHVILNVDEIKKLIVQLGYTLRDERFEPN
jgi:hypothetical protein